METDSFQLGFVAALLRAEADAIARRAARLLIDQGLSDGWGPEAPVVWGEALESRVLELAAAVGSGRPGDLADRAAWARVAFEARGTPARDLARSLRALRQAALEAVPEEDAATILAAMDPAIVAAEAPVAELPVELSTSAAHGKLAAGYLLALLEGDRLRATRMVYEAVRGGVLGVPEAYTRVLLPVLRELGRMWHMGEIHVAEEHFATATTLIAMSQLAPLAAVKPANGRVLVAATVAGNLHEIGVRMVADRFEWEGWRVVYLGPSVPAEDLAQSVQDFGAEVVALSAALIVHIEPLERAIAAVRALVPGVRIIVGGQALAGDGAMAARLGADAVALDAEEALRTATRWDSRAE